MMCLLPPASPSVVPLLVSRAQKDKDVALATRVLRNLTFKQALRPALVEQGASSVFISLIASKSAEVCVLCPCECVDVVCTTPVSGRSSECNGPECLIVFLLRLCAMVPNFSLCVCDVFVATGAAGLHRGPVEPAARGRVRGGGGGPGRCGSSLLRVAKSLRELPPVVRGVLSPSLCAYICRSTVLLSRVRFLSGSHCLLCVVCTLFFACSGTCSA